MRKFSFFAGFMMLASSVMAQGYSWTGVYGGISGGFAQQSKSNYEHTNTNNFAAAGTKYSNDVSGVMYGPFAGYNQQFGHLVVGAEVGMHFGDLVKGGAYDAGTKIESSTVETNSFFAKGRVGLAAGRFLFFGTAGYAGATTKTGLVYTGGSKPLTWTDQEWRNSYLLGAGVDVGITEHIFVGAEYNWRQIGGAQYSGLDSTTTGNPPVPAGRLTQVKVAGVIDQRIMGRLGVKW